MKDISNRCSEDGDSKSNKCDHQNANQFHDSSFSQDPMKSDLSEIKTKQKSIWQSLLRCRYIVTLLEFFVFFEIDAYRLATSMSVVAMVNNTAISSNENLNLTIETCPINDSVTSELSLPHNDGEFDWSPEIQGYVLGAGFMGYVISQIPGGLLAEAYGAKITIVGGLFLSSVAHVLCPFAAVYNSYLMIMMQLLRGLGQNDGEFDWSPEIQGYVLGAGFMGYVISQIPGGLLAEAYGAKITIVGGLFLSSVAHVLCPFAAVYNSYLMIMMQLLRGLGQNDGEFDWSPEIQGYVLGAGFMGYVISQIPGGLLAEAYGAKITIVGGLFLSSVAHVLCPFAAVYNSYLMIMMQLLRGLGQNDGEFDWSPEVQGYVLGAGFMGYVISQIPGGLLAEAYGAKITIVGGLFLSSVAHVRCPFAVGYNSYLMIMMQLLVQGLLPPAHSVLSANWFPNTERGFLNALIMGGSVLGSLISSFLSGALCSSTLLGGWPSVYYIYGGLGLVLCLCIQIFLYESPRVHPRIEKIELNYIVQNQETDLSQKRPPTPWRKILTSIPVYAMTYAIFSHFWAITHQISVQPVYLGNVLHYPIQENGILTSIPFIFQALLIFIGGWISKWLITQNYIGIDNARKWCTLLYSIGYSVGVLGMYIAGCDRVWSNVFSIIAMSFIGLSVPGCMVAPMDMSPTFAGSLFGLSNTIASSASFLLPVITGLMLNEVQTLAQWNNIFFMCTAVIMSAGIVFCIFGSAEVQPWNFQENRQRTRL